MEYHDFKLDGYEVSDRGRSIALHLIHENPNTPKGESTIRFSDVALYNFTHTTAAVITDIEEGAIADLLEEIGSRLFEWRRLHGVDSWTGNIETYREALQTDGYRAWRIQPAIGFYGFIVAKEVCQVGA